MSRSSYTDEFGAWAEPEDRHATVDKMRAKAGIAPDDAPAAPAEPSPYAANRLAYLDRREGMLHPPGSFSISPTLAKMLRYSAGDDARGAVGDGE